MSLFRKAKPKVPQITCPATGEICHYYPLCEATRRGIEAGHKLYPAGFILAYPELVQVADIVDTEPCSERAIIALSEIAIKSPEGSYVELAAEGLANQRLEFRAQLATWEA